MDKKPIGEIKLISVYQAQVHQIAIVSNIYRPYTSSAEII